MEIKIPEGSVANNIYYKIGNGTTMEYTSPVKVNENTTVEVWYVDELGNTSEVKTFTVNTIS